MPTRAARPCAYPGCAALVQVGYCDAHKRVHHTEYHREWDHLYHTARWRRFRVAYLANHPWCVDCLERSIYTVATTVDHITPHRGNLHLFWSGPFQALCASCHSRKTGMELHG